jgi:hypothetical protein
MRPGVIAAAGIYACCAFGVSQASEISDQGATELRRSLTSMLSDDLAKSGFIEVRPANGAYEVTLDLAKFFDKIGSSDFSITGIKPQTMLVTPLPDNLWNFEGSGSNDDISAHSRLGHGPATDMSYSLGSFTYSGVFDPAISYMRSTDVAAKDLRMSSSTGLQTVTVTAAGMTYKTAAIDGTEPGRVNLHATGTMPSIYEKVSSPTTPALELRADSVDFDVSMESLPIREARDLLRFVFQHVKAKNLSKKGSDRFEELARAVLPVFASLRETVTANNLTISTANGHAGIGKLDYSFGMNGIVNAARIDFGMRAQDLSLSEVQVPKAYAPLVPQSAELQIAIPGLNFADAADALLKADLSKQQPLSQQEGARIGALVLPGGTLVIDIPKVSAKSPMYEIEMSGKITSDIHQKGRLSAQATILARDYDKTISYIQGASKQDPQLSQVSFGLMMAKGFAKTDPDGRQRWEVVADADGTVTVNGQVMRSPGSK